MSELIIWAIGIGMMLYGLDIALQEREVLGFIRKYVDLFLQELYELRLYKQKLFFTFILKPVILCPVCMSSVWGGTIGLLAGFGWQVLGLIPMVAAAVMTLINLEKDGK